jgi:predicted GNAT family acetyltransferase
LARRPYDNVYSHWLIAGGGLRDGACVVARDSEGEVGGVCTFGTHLIPSTDRKEAVDAFAMLAQQVPPPRSIVGVRTVVERLWNGLRAAVPEPFAVRASQPVYALERAAFQPDRSDADVARATPREIDEIARHSAAMTAAEIGRGPRPDDPVFRARIERLIAAGKWWRYRVGGRLAFTCNVGSESPRTAQLQGVWTPPDMRGYGHATRGMSEICNRLLDEHPTLCLYVNDFNTAATALYERLGFARVGEFQSIFL